MFSSRQCRSTVVCLEYTDIRVAFGTCKYLRYISTRDITKELGYEKARAFPMCLAFTGCNTVASFAGRRKKTAFDIWKSFGEIPSVFSTLLADCSAFNDDCMSVLEAYVVLLYDHTCAETTVNSARKHLFTTKARSMNTIPPPTQPCDSTQKGQ